MKWEQNFGGGSNVQSVAQNRIVSNGGMVKELERIVRRLCWPNLRHHSDICMEEMAEVKERIRQDSLRAAF